MVKKRLIKSMALSFDGNPNTATLEVEFDDDQMSKCPDCGSPMKGTRNNRYKCENESCAVIEVSCHKDGTVKRVFRQPLL